MPINRAIPGQLLEEEMQAIEAIAQLVPSGGTIVEVGSLLGKSSWIWAKSAATDVTVVCIDPWERGGGSNFEALAANNAQTFTKRQFLKNMDGCHNVVSAQGFSPDDFLQWDPPIDLYFEDAVHQNPILARNIEFWSAHLKPTGILCGHDYTERFPDVIEQAKLLAHKTNRRLRIIGTLWFLLPSSLGEATDLKIRAAMERLVELEGLAMTATAIEVGESKIGNRKRVISSLGELKHNIELLSRQQTLSRGERLILFGRATNTSQRDWPVIIGSEHVLKVGAELYSGPQMTKVAAARFHLEQPVVQSGDSVPFELELPTSRADIGPCSVMIDLVYDDVTWFGDRGGGQIRVHFELI